MDRLGWSPDADDRALPRPINGPPLARPRPNHPSPSLDAKLAEYCMIGQAAREGLVNRDVRGEMVRDE